MGLWRDEVAVLFVRQVTAQALPYAKPALKRPACCIIVITVTKSQAAQIKPITEHHANQLYQHGTLALLVPGLLEGTTTIGELLTHGDTGIGTGEGLDGELIILDGVAYKVGQSGVAERVPDDFTMPFANVHHAAFQYQCERRDIGLEDLNNRIVEANGRANTFFSVIVRGTFSFIKTRAVIKQQAPYPTLVEVADREPPSPVFTSIFCQTIARSAVTCSTRCSITARYTVRCSTRWCSICRWMILSIATTISGMIR